MPPKKKVERPATENISLGPQVREGATHPQAGPRTPAFADSSSQVKWSSASPVSSTRRRMKPGSTHGLVVLGSGQPIEVAILVLVWVAAAALLAFRYGRPR